MPDKYGFNTKEDQMKALGMSNKADDAIKKLVETVSRNQHKLERGTTGYTSARVRDEEAATELKQALYQDYLDMIHSTRVLGPPHPQTNIYKADLIKTVKAYYGVDT